LAKDVVALSLHRLVHNAKAYVAKELLCNDPRIRMHDLFDFEAHVVTLSGGRGGGKTMVQNLQFSRKVNR
jgi:hypothetical protein